MSLCQTSVQQTIDTAKKHMLEILALYDDDSVNRPDFTALFNMHNQHDTSYVSNVEVMMNALVTGVWTNHPIMFGKLYSIIMKKETNENTSTLRNLLDVISEYPDVVFNLLDILVANAIHSRENDLIESFELFEQFVNTRAFCANKIINHLFFLSIGSPGISFIRLPLLKLLLDRCSPDVVIMIENMNNLFDNRDYIVNPSGSFETAVAYAEVIKCVMDSPCGKSIRATFDKK